MGGRRPSLRGGFRVKSNTETVRVRGRRLQKLGLLSPLYPWRHKGKLSPSKIHWGRGALYNMDPRISETLCAVNQKREHFVL